MSDRLFPLDEVPEVPIFREPRRVGARDPLDQRFKNDYPPEWDKCTACGGQGQVVSGMVWGQHDGPGTEGYCLPTHQACSACLGMGSLKARVRLEAGHRCIRCSHPYIPKGDAKMLGVEPSGLHVVGVEDRSLTDVSVPEGVVGHVVSEGHLEKVWTPWSACDSQCTHDGPYRIWAETDWREGTLLTPQVLHLHYLNGTPVEAEWRILTVHHFDGDKANVRWWNLGSLCQRCHLYIQHKVVMERVYPFEHSEWFRPYVAGYYAWVYLGEDLTREQTMERLDELLSLELVSFVESNVSP